jgi:integrase
MPRRRSPPRLYLDSKRGQWAIRDGSRFIRTGCPESERGSAEKRLAAYIGQKHAPERGPDPLIADMLLTYTREHLPHTRASKNAAYLIDDLSQWWGDKHLSDVTARACRAYAATRTPASARLRLEILRAAIGYWHREYGPLPSLPAVVMPPKPEPRDKWLTRSEAARLLRAARHTEHIKRFILLGLQTGSRRSSITSLTWDRIDFAAGVMLRRDRDETESNKRTPPVRLSKRMIGFLRRWRAADGDHSKYVVHWGGKKIYRFGKSWKRICAAAGVVATPHTLRHSRATWLMQAGINEYQAAGHLGMSVAILHKHYAKHSPDFQKQAAEL